MTDDELARAAATALKDRFPEPADVDVLSGLQAPTFGRRRTTILAAAACVLVVAGVSAGLALTSGNEHPTAAPDRSSPRQGATQSVIPAGPTCTRDSAHTTVRLGGPKWLGSNSGPLPHGTVRMGHLVRVVATLRTTPKLAFPASRSHDLLLICRFRHRSTYTSYFRAVHLGTANVLSRTSGCARCENTTFRARITVIGAQTQLARLRTLAFAAVPNEAVVEKITAVRSTDAHAVRVLTGDVVQDNSPVWVVQVQTARPFPCTCSSPPGVAAPRGRYMVLYLDVADLTQTDYSLGMHPSSLGKLGDVITLYSR